MQDVTCIVLDTDNNINLPIEIVFPLGHISISTAPVENAKQFIEEDNYLFKRNEASVAHIDDDQLTRVDALLNFGCARRKKPFLWPARLSIVSCTTQSCSNTTE